MQRRGRRSGAQLAPHAGQPRHPGPFSAPPPPRFHSVAQRVRGSGASPGQPGPRRQRRLQPSWAAADATDQPSAPPAACAPCGGTAGAGAREGRASSSAAARLRLSRRSSQSWSAARLPEGTRHLLRCGVAPRCAPRERERAAAPPPAPGKLPLLPPLRGSCRRLPASEGDKSPTRSAAREKSPHGRSGPLRLCFPVPPRAGGMMEPPAAAACASCRRRLLPPPPLLLLCLLLAALCLPPGERPPAEKGDRAVPAARNLSEGRPGPQVAVSARGSLLPAGSPSLARPSFTGAPRHLPRGPVRGCASLSAVGALRIPFCLGGKRAGAGPLLPPPPDLGKAAEDGRRGELMPPPLRERQELFQRCGGLRGGSLAFPHGKRPWGPSGALSPAVGQRRWGSARRPFHFQAGRATRLRSEPPPTSAAQPLPFSSSSEPPVAVPGCPPLSRCRRTRARECRRRGAVQQPAGCGVWSEGEQPRCRCPLRGQPAEQRGGSA